jgi:hypothetical protein
MGLAFAARSCTEGPSERSLCPFAPRVISVHAELRLGHLRYYLTDVPPQPNSPSDFCLKTRGRTRKDAYDLKRTRPGTRRFLTSEEVPADPPSFDEQSDDANSGISRLACTSHLFYTLHVTAQSQTRVKLNRVFFPRRHSQVRSPDCCFAG